MSRKNYLKIKNESPWILNYRAARNRCENKNVVNYKRYGGKGIKFLLTIEEIKILWFRDKSYLLHKPSLDRKNSLGNYEFSNCRFIEFSENARANKKGNQKSNHRVEVLYFANTGNSKEYLSLAQAAREFGVNPKTIHNWCVKNKEWKSKRSDYVNKDM